MLESTENELLITSESKFPWGNIVSLGAAFGILFCGFWIASSFTQPKQVTTDHEANIATVLPENPGTLRSRRIKSAFAARQELLEMDDEIRKKHERKKFASSNTHSTDRESIYKAWRDQKEQTQKYYERFKDDVTSDPNSVKLQLQDSLKRLESDKPRR